MMICDVCKADCHGKAATAIDLDHLAGTWPNGAFLSFFRLNETAREKLGSLPRQRELCPKCFAGYVLAIAAIELEGLGVTSTAETIADNPHGFRDECEGTLADASADDKPRGLTVRDPRW